MHIPSRVSSDPEVPVRLGPSVTKVPDYGASRMKREVYADPTRFELERERVLDAGWLLAGRSETIPDAGDWLTFESHGETVVLVRQPDGTVAGFHNVCMHRGVAIVGEEKGCGAKSFTCPYHGWIYDTTGKVKGVPERIDFDPEHLSGLRSPAVAADEWGGWLWVHLAGPQPKQSLTDWIGEEIMVDLGEFKMEDMVLLDVLEWDVPVSYKAIVDGFNEIYHTGELHGVPPEWTKAARDTSFWIVNDHNYMCFVPRHDCADVLPDDWDHHKYAICHYVVFPNTVFNCNPDHVQVFNPIPIDVDRTRFLCWELVYPGDENDPEYAEYRKRVSQHWERLKRVVAEDIEIYEALARTKRSRAYTHNVLNERECKIAHYHEVMDAMIRDSQ